MSGYVILQSPAGPGFDDLVALATQICDTPVGLISFVASDRQWFKARIGFAPCETPLSQSVCAHALAERDILIIPDLTQDLRTRDNTLVTGEPFNGYRDSFGNWRSRMVAPAGRFTLKTDTIVRDTGGGDPQAFAARETAVEELPSDTVLFLLGSRYCETDRLSSITWDLFGHLPPGWGRVQAICDYVHDRITFGYEHARATRTAFEAFDEGHGVCRDYAHLAIAFCRCLNIPARYCNGYVSDIGLPLPHAPGDFAAWTEVYLGGRWHTFDPRNNSSRIGRILIAYGRDAADVPLTLTFGPNELVGFSVTTEEAPPVP